MPKQEDVEMELVLEESDLQPAHRAEALDVLASIELKFALLRERVFVEKMEELGEEEAMVWNGSFLSFSLVLFFLIWENADFYW